MIPVRISLLFAPPNVGLFLRPIVRDVTLHTFSHPLA